MSILSLADLRKFPFFRCFTKQELIELLSHVERRTLEPDTFLFRENESGQALFVIETGKVEVLKREGRCGRLHALSTLSTGDVIGEMAWIDHAPRFASAKSSGKVQLLVISHSALSTVSAESQLRVHRYLNQQLSHRLKDTTTQFLKQQLESTKLRLAMSRFIVYLTILIFFYFYSMIIINLIGLKVASSTLISLPILVVFGLMMIHMMRRSGYPLRMYGLTWQNGWRSFFESLGITAVVLAFIVMVKWWLIGNEAVLEGTPLFQPSYASNPGDSAALSRIDVVLLILGYCLFTPVQELIYRGALQSSLQTFFTGRHRTLSAILISNLPFSMIHLQISFSLAIAVYFLGVLWGWMFFRQKTLVGVVISHLIIGAFVFFVLGIQSILSA